MIVMSAVGWLKIFTTIEFNEQQVASCICYFICDSLELNLLFIWSRNKMNVSSTYYSNNYERRFILLRRQLQLHWTIFARIWTQSTNVDNYRHRILSVCRRYTHALYKTVNGKRNTDELCKTQKLYGFLTWCTCSELLILNSTFLHMIQVITFCQDFEFPQNLLFSLQSIHLHICQ